MKTFVLSLFTLLFFWTGAVGQKKDTVPTMVPKRITQRAPELTGVKEGLSLEDSTAQTVKKDSISFGINVGIDLSNVLAGNSGSFGFLGGFKNTPKTGLSLGLYVSIPISRKVFLQPELNYVEKGYIAVVDVGKFRRTYAFIDLPLLLKYYPGKQLYFMIGPQLSYLVQTNDFFYGASNLDVYKAYLRQTSNLRSLQPGLVFGMGFQATKHLAFSATYSLDFLTNYKFIGLDAPKFRNEYFSLRLGYRFSNTPKFRK